jgi:site-specific recombinase XerD
MLQKEFSIEAVSKMLGHGDIRTTQKHYARVTDKRVEMEVTKLLG